MLSTDLEYGALDLTWEHVCGDFGARYVRTPIRLPVTSAEEIVETVWAGVGPRTSALFLSHHTSSTAMTLPVGELCRRAREAGIRTIVDGAHAPAHLPLNLRAIAWQHEHDWDSVRERCHELARRARNELGLEPLTPDSQEFFRQMVALRVPKDAPKNLQERLYGDHRIEVPVFERGRDRFIRASFQGYNDAGDLERLETALNDLLP